MKRSKESTFLAIIVLTGLSTTGMILILNKNESSNPQSDSTPQRQVSREANYNDGSYSATGTYPTQGGRESISLTVIVAKNLIMDASVIQNGITPQAKEYQERFVSSYKELVIGKKIDEVSLSRVAGSSLTSIGFNKALEQIKSNASK